jgi:tetratricopeptide (TPR) repeat protein
LGLAEWQDGNLHEATRVFGEVVASAPGFVDAYLNLSEVLKTQDRFDEARSVLAKARESVPEHLGVLGKLAALLEETGAAEEAENLTRRGLALDPDDPFLNLTAAKCERRRGQLQAAIKRLERIGPMLGHTELDGVILKTLGQLYDRVSEYSLAFQKLRAGNEILARDAIARGVDAGDFLHENDAACSPIVDAPPQHMPSTGAPDRLPVFLVGFPRSGTTLLNQILDNHPRLQSLEEKPAVDAMLQAVLGAPDIASLLADPVALRQLRTAYFSVVDQNLELAPDTSLVDKYPLNILRMPLIYRVFPGAKVLLALRHPCDACLSCYMQSFKLNSAMASFLSLEQTARLYVAAMQRWQWCVENLGMNVHVVRYESLVDDFQKEVETVLEFLGLPWDDAVADFAESARQRGRISTPSYHQITQPIYRHAVNRWRNYADHLHDILPSLTPFIRAFGYDLESG